MLDGKFIEFDGILVVGKFVNGTIGFLDVSYWIDWGIEMFEGVKLI